MGANHIPDGSQMPQNNASLHRLRGLPPSRTRLVSLAKAMSSPSSLVGVRPAARAGRPDEAKRTASPVSSASSGSVNEELPSERLGPSERRHLQLGDVHLKVESKRGMAKRRVWSGLRQCLGLVGPVGEAPRGVFLGSVSAARWPTTWPEWRL